MPIHDWRRVEPGIYHAFHSSWITHLSAALNRGILPPGYYALGEQVAAGLGPDVLTLRQPTAPAPVPPGGLALAEAPPQVSFRYRSETNRYQLRARSVPVRHVSNHRVVAVIEIVSPGNKDNRHGLNAFVQKARELLASGIHLLVIDLFPPTERDPFGIHRAIWGLDENDTWELAPERPLGCVSYVGGAACEFFGESCSVGSPLPEMPLFLTPDVYIPVPLERTYTEAFDDQPEFWREVVAGIRSADS